jgi:hypothetical protein
MAALPASANIHGNPSNHTCSVLEAYLPPTDGRLTRLRKHTPRCQEVGKSPRASNQPTEKKLWWLQQSILRTGSKNLQAHAARSR